LSVFRATAARFADQYALGLHAGDALDLAIAVDHGATLSLSTIVLPTPRPALASAPGCCRSDVKSDQYFLQVLCAIVIRARLNGLAVSLFLWVLRSE
jgi:hypothetical protein